jgi:hypothetical protein
LVKGHRGIACGKVLFTNKWSFYYGFLLIREICGINRVEKITGDRVITNNTTSERTLGNQCPLGLIVARHKI